MSENATLLSPPANFAVVQLPSRNYPGIIVQGDTMKSILVQMKTIVDLMNSGESDEALEELEDIREMLASSLAHYEYVCATNNINLPYNREA